MPVQRLPEPLLVQRVPDQADRAGQDEEAVEVADANDLADLGLEVFYIIFEKCFF